ncbi:Uu.00g064730.m01.CDS01 [Anthostomella pinea]|uniref:Uu.00g064730.m01.CDS01 n=1 Tax=Anthostomella pinea TaxID=933095 RepID=A0AAI8YN36_9PEZI|nr:Uu.00g064730.m01.CDS01 [Anthostomella pinea]
MTRTKAAARRMPRLSKDPSAYRTIKKERKVSNDEQPRTEGREDPGAHEEAQELHLELYSHHHAHNGNSTAAKELRQQLEPYTGGRKKTAAEKVRIKGHNDKRRERKEAKKEAKKGPKKEAKKGPKKEAEAEDEQIL